MKLSNYLIYENARAKMIAPCDVVSTNLTLHHQSSSRRRYESGFAATEFEFNSVSRLKYSVNFLLILSTAAHNLAFRFVVDFRNNGAYCRSFSRSSIVCGIHPIPRCGRFCRIH